MQRFDRILGILLFLRSQETVSASELAQHFGVSTRTLYRDVETLSVLGIPVYAERGRNGGFRLLEGYFLPPVMFSREEAISLLLGLTLLRGLRTHPFPNTLKTAEQKILAALPDTLRATLENTQKIIGFERFPNDVFHPEAQGQAHTMPAEQLSNQESQIITIFLQAILDGKYIHMDYQSPYKSHNWVVTLRPLGLFWDRNRWYLVGQQPHGKNQIWRADRVSQIEAQQSSDLEAAPFDVGELMGHRWLRAALNEWRQRAPVKILLTCSQAQRIQQDWYYGHASFEPCAENWVLMTFGESNPSFVIELLRWLGPGAELLEPQVWRKQIRADLQAMLAQYNLD